MKNSKLACSLLILTVTMLGLTSICLAGAAPAAGNVREIVKKASPSVVRVEVRDGLRRVATGVVIDKDGYVATTALISPREEELKVIDYEGNQAEADFLGFDPESRIAFLHVKNKKLPAISMGSSAGLAPGSWVCALGISPESQIQVTQGIVSSVTADRFRLNITITPGMSGGPVLNEKGQLIGLLRGVYAGDRSYFPGPRQTPPLGYPFEQMETPPLGMAMAIPVEMLNDIFKEIKTKGKVERGWLGVSIREDADQRVIISEVEDESPASLARIQPGDRVLKINGKEIKNADQFASEIRRHHPGQQITLTIDRQGKMLEIEARLGNLPEEEAFRELELRFPDIFRQFPRDLPLTPRPGGQNFEFGVQNYGFLGIFLEQLTPELSKYFGVPEGRGLLVARLIRGGPAEKAGLKIGDVIVGADGKRVETLTDLSRILQNKKKVEKLALEIIRDRKKMELEIEVSGSILEEGRD